jgi:hypothetical protein
VPADRHVVAVFPGATAPPRDGASAYVRGVIRALAEHGHELTLLVPSPSRPVGDPAAAYPAARRVEWVDVPPPASGVRARLERTGRSLAALRPAWVDLYATADAAAAARRAEADTDVVVGFGAAASGILTRLAKPSVLLLFSLPSDDAARLGAPARELRLARAFERALARRHDVVAATTAAERDRLGADAVALPFPRVEKTRLPAGSEPRLLFIADWNYPPNRAGLSFLLERVLPSVWARFPDLALVLAGKGSQSVAAPAAAGPVVTHGEYESLADVADDATIAILPLLAAGGVRTRVLELLAAGLPTVATVEAASGIAAAGLVATEPERFAGALLEVLAAPDTVRRAAREVGGAWPTDAEVAARWSDAFDVAIRRAGRRR